MKRGARTAALAAAIAVLSTAAGVFVYLSDGARETERALSARLYAATLPDPQGAPQALAQWRGRVLVVNFWATWCAPCREEIPGFVRLQARLGGKGVQFVGVALDQAGPAAEFARAFRMNYPVLLGGGTALEWMRLAGNSAGVLPYTLVLDRHGRIALRHRGLLDEKALAAHLSPLLAQ